MNFAQGTEAVADMTESASTSSSTYTAAATAVSSSQSCNGWMESGSGSTSDGLLSVAKSNCSTVTPPSGGTSVEEGFVFGSNISSRVTTASTSCASKYGSFAEDKDKLVDSSSDAGADSGRKATATATSALISDNETDDGDKAVSSSTESSTAAFGQLAASVSGYVSSGFVSLNEEATNSSNVACGGLAESAQRYQEHLSCQRPELDSVEVLTGEEGESNVLHLRAKAYYLLAEEKRWAERGRGYLRLNDLPPEEEGTVYRSRLIFRQTGALKVLFNTLVWRDMACEIVTDKSVRLSAQEPTGQVAFYLLILQNSNEANQLCQALSHRLQLLQSSSKSPAVCAASEKEQVISGRGGHNYSDEDDEDEEEEAVEKSIVQSSSCTKRRYNSADDVAGGSQKEEDKEDGLISKEVPTSSTTSMSSISDKRARLLVDVNNTDCSTCDDLPKQT